ncbi:lipoyltransferase 1, mitochondrial [Callorhinchus milii]|uniref:lipoyltransferase 1, mitochondrial n=1 Tax=Callorhinchus milii TaxID=7868 RepID=UPI00045761E8|nr:lipoyltransferase 1, mitochondrial [Callorhinchus milii]|eukprot:gi/632947990/ref/XP_007889348.1/ PREDICTED: lipoyltransferase 1, mitochondrial [Callorhinchus milii]
MRPGTLLLCFSSATRCCSALDALSDAAGGALVFQSVSTDVYRNLAAEDWLHQNLQPAQEALLLWRNSPAVVIGRHQNPWQECDLRLMRERGIKLSRRKSGGGSVYHDLGNFNMTFFTSRQAYDRRRNLETVLAALKRLRPSLDVSATDRHDLLLSGAFKVSGTAAKIGRTSAYHHCTLLCRSDRTALSSALRSPYWGIRSNATPSVPATVKNLCEEDPTLTCDVVMGAVAEEYTRCHGQPNRVLLIDPDNHLTLPGVNKCAEELRSWEWVYGKTPKFSVSHCFTVDYNLSRAEVKLNMVVNRGSIESCNIEMLSDWLPAELCHQLASNLIGARFCPTETTVLASAHLRAWPRQDDELQNRWNAFCEKVKAIM